MVLQYFGGRGPTRWGPRAEGPRIEGRGPRVEEHKHLFFTSNYKFCAVKKDYKNIHITFKWSINQFFLLNTFSFLFSQTFLLINSISFSFEPWIFWQLPSCFWISSNFLSIFWMLWMLVTEIYTMKDIDNVYGVRYITK